MKRYKDFTENEISCENEDLFYKEVSKMCGLTLQEARIGRSSMIVKGLFFGIGLSLLKDAKLLQSSKNPNTIIGKMIVKLGSLIGIGIFSVIGQFGEMKRISQMTKKLK